MNAKSFAYWNLGIQGNINFSQVGRKGTCSITGSDYMLWSLELIKTKKENGCMYCTLLIRLGMWMKWSLRFVQNQMLVDVDCENRRLLFFLVSLLAGSCVYEFYFFSQGLNIYRDQKVCSFYPSNPHTSSIFLLPLTFLTRLSPTKPSFFFNYYWYFISLGRNELTLSC